MWAPSDSAASQSWKLLLDRGLGGDKVNDCLISGCDPLREFTELSCGSSSDRGPENMEDTWLKAELGSIS